MKGRVFRYRRWHSKFMYVFGLGLGLQNRIRGIGGRLEIKGICSCEPTHYTDEDKYARRRANMDKASGYVELRRIPHVE